jgi:hypothetical protein
MSTCRRLPAGSPSLAAMGFNRRYDREIRMSSRPWLALAAVSLLACSSRSDRGGQGMPLTNGNTVPLPAACRVADTGQGPYQVTVRLRNTGQRAVFFANTYSCGVATTISSCAGEYRDRLNEEGILCPCDGPCPVGGPGCGPAEIRVAAGEMQQVVWQASITIRGTKGGQECAERSQALPAARYRVTAKVFATPQHAIAGSPVLHTLEQDFELPAPGGVVDLPFAIEEQPSADGGAPADAGACLPLASVRREECPRTWGEAIDHHAGFCAKEWRGGMGSFSAERSATACRGFLRYTRHLWDAGPRMCIYDPITLELRGYHAIDGKAMYQAITCGLSREDFDDKDCPLVSCADLASALPACRWPSNLDNVDPSTGQCRGARTLLSCSLAGGATQICLSNDPNRCPDTGTAVADAGTAAACTNLCAPGEYAAACGKVGPGTIPDPPAGCKNARPTPGGVIFYSCPCGS